MANFDLTQPITVNGTTFEPTDLNQSMLHVHGVEPTDFEEWVYCNILAQHKNVKATKSGHRAGGNAQANYLYHELADLSRFHEHKYPYLLPVVTTKVADKKGNLRDLVLFVDFANIQELNLVPANKNNTVDGIAHNVTKSVTPAIQAEKAPAPAKA